MSIVRASNTLSNLPRGARGIAATALATGAYLGASALNGAVKGAGERAYKAAQRYFRGDPNQPATATTVQQLQPMRPGKASRRRVSARGGGATVVERGSLRLADVTTGSTVHTGSAISSLPLQLENIGGRLFAMSKLYSRWRFVSAILRYVPSVGSTTDGGIVVYYSQEPDDVYQVGEPVGAENATSAIDNIEFSVREKASMRLHVNPQLLYTTPSGSEKTWHSAGVVNVIDNGALVANKTYGTIYLDFVVQFTQPCAPFDAYAPLYMNNVAIHGDGATGVNGGNLFRWSDDAAALAPASGPQWLIDPSTGSNNIHGKIYLPPLSSCVYEFSVADASTSSAYPAIALDAGVVAPAATRHSSADNTLKESHAVITNTNAFPAGFRLYSQGSGMTLSEASMVLAACPFTR